MLGFALAVLPASLTSGLNLYLTVLGLGMASRFGFLQLPLGLDYVDSIPVMGVAGVLVVIEFFADKVPFVDSAWDFLHMVVRPAGALALALGALPPDQAEATVAVAMLSGGTALTAHTGKASLRALINTSPEPATNTVASVVEDTFVVGMLVLAIRYPTAAGIVAALATVMILVATYFIIRWAVRTFGSVRAFFATRRKRPEPVG